MLRIPLLLVALIILASASCRSTEHDVVPPGGISQAGIDIRPESGSILGLLYDVETSSDGDSITFSINHEFPGEGFTLATKTGSTRATIAPGQRFRFEYRRSGFPKLYLVVMKGGQPNADQRFVWPVDANRFDANAKFDEPFAVVLRGGRRVFSLDLFGIRASGLIEDIKTTTSPALVVEATAIAPPSRVSVAARIPQPHGINNCAIDIRPEEPITITYGLHDDSGNLRDRLQVSITTPGALELQPVDINTGAAHGDPVSLGAGKTNLQFYAPHDGSSITANITSTTASHYPSRGQYGRQHRFTPPTVVYLQRSSRSRVTVDILGAKVAFDLTSH